MFIEFFFTLRKYKVPVSIRELLDLLNAMDKQVVFADSEGFYLLARTLLVKDEVHFDKFDRAFAEYYQGVQYVDLEQHQIPDEWLRQQLQRFFTKEEMDEAKSMGGLEQLLKTLQERLKEQQKRHQGGNKWIGTSGTSPFGAFGYNPEGIRIGQDKNRHFKAVKVWDKREFKNFDNDRELGTRNLKLALKKLRKFARTGASDTLDIDGTIRKTANNAGYLDLQMLPERHNAVKLLLFFDVGGSMDYHIQIVEELFSAIHAEFKHIRFYYFHNCLYEKVWQDNRRRREEYTLTTELLHKFGRDYKVIFVGDATMGPYEIAYSGGSVEHWNEESGEVWMDRVTSHFDKCVWINPQPKGIWHYHHSINMMRDIMDNRMFALTLDGIEQAIKELV